MYRKSSYPSSPISFLNSLPKQCREARDLEPICVICIDTKDDPQQAVIAGRVAVNLAQKVRLIL